MRQLESLRSLLLGGVSELKKAPEKLQVWADGGSIVFKNQMKLPSHRNSYTANILVTDFSGELESILFPLMAFCKKYCSEGEETEIKYEAEIIDRSRSDVLFEIELADYVSTDVDSSGNVVIEPMCEPPYGTRDYYFVSGNKKVAMWNL